MNERAMREYTRWAERVTDPELAEQLAAMKGDEKAIEDAFFQDLEFGTAGLRGVLGAGSNRMNVYTVALATQGLANYLKANFDKPSVAICRDSRHKGELFCHVAAEVLAANGVAAHLYPRLEPTPACSFATRDLGCSAGINITASHNPAEYNGYKVYGADGCQITTQASKGILAAIGQVDIFDGVARMPFDEAMDAGLVDYIGEGTIERFVDAVAQQSQHVEVPADGADLKVVYTPLNGAGLECVSKILGRIGVTDVTVVPEQAQPDGDFPTCPYPNPEIRQALQKGLELCAEVHPDLLLATDPDADRTGIAVPHMGEYVLLSGNEVGVLLSDWLATRAAARGENVADKLVVTTIVSSSMLDALARKHGFELRRTLTGFKYIGEQIARLEEKGEQGRFLFGFEESYGYLSGTYVRDKDAVVASMLICEMARDYKGRGMDLVDAVEALYDELGYYRNRTISLAYPGAEGAEQMRAIMAGLRTEHPAQLAGLAVEGVVDYAQGATMPRIGGDAADEQTLPGANVFEINLEGANKVIIRPSGTEPKIKAYVFARGTTDAEALALVDELDTTARKLLGA